VRYIRGPSQNEGERQFMMKIGTIQQSGEYAVCGFVPSRETEQKDRYDDILYYAQKKQRRG
jgi:hypothetical protein